METNTVVVDVKNADEVVEALEVAANVVELAVTATKFIKSMGDIDLRELNDEQVDAYQEYLYASGAVEGLEL